MALNLGLVASFVILQDYRETWEKAGEVSSRKACITNDEKLLSIELSTGFTVRRENVANVRKGGGILQFRRDLLSPLTNKETNKR